MIDGGNKGGFILVGVFKSVLIVFMFGDIVVEVYQVVMFIDVIVVGDFVDFKVCFVVIGIVQLLFIGQ